MLQGGDNELRNLAGNSLAEGEEEALKDQHRAGAAQDGQGLARKEAEDEASKGCAQEALQHPLKCREGVPGGREEGCGPVPPAAQKNTGSVLGTTTGEGGRIQAMLRMSWGCW